MISSNLCSNHKPVFHFLLRISEGSLYSFWAFLACPCTETAVLFEAIILQSKQKFATNRLIFKSWLKCVSHAKTRKIQTLLVLFRLCSWITWRRFSTFFNQSDLKIGNLNPQISQPRSVFHAAILLDLFKHFVSLRSCFLKIRAYNYTLLGYTNDTNTLKLHLHKKAKFFYSDIHHTNAQ